MHLGLRTDPSCLTFCTKLEKPRSFRKVPDGTYTYFPNGNLSTQNKICITLIKFFTHGAEKGTKNKYSIIA